MAHPIARAGSAAAALAFGLLFAAGSAVPASAAELAEPTTEIEDGRVVLVLDGTETSNQFVPKGGAPTAEFPEGGPAVGDAFIFTDELRQDGVLVGTSQGRCTVAPENAITCAATLTFAGGTVTASGPVSGGQAENAPSTVAITSGTGNYAGINGTLTILDATDAADPTDTLGTLTLRYLLPPQTTQVSAVPVGGASTGGGVPDGSTDALLLVGVGLAAVAGSIGLFGAAHVAGRRD